MDLKAAFDKVDRETLIRILKEEGITKGIIDKIEKIYEIMEVVMRTLEGLKTETFNTKIGIRQGCLLSPILFNLCIADIDKE